LCKEIIARGLSVHATELLIKQPVEGPIATSLTGNEERPPAGEKTAHVEGIEQELRERLATRVEIRLRGPDRGQIVLGFASNDDFERLLEVLRGGERSS
jgi:ParB family chromosome partitioning protein